MKGIQERLLKHFIQLVPDDGPSGIVAGELVGATSIIWHFFHDGDEHRRLGNGYATCDSAGRYLMRNGTREIVALVTALWGMENGAAYGAVLEVLTCKVLDYVEANPHLRYQLTDDTWL